MRLNPRRFSVKLSDGDLRRLQVFCTVTRCGGFAAAESELQIGLPSISRYIKDLEIRLGMRLCRRGRVGFELTDQGRRVYAASQQLTADLQRFEDNMASIHTALVGTLRLGIIDTLITDRSLPLPRVLEEYKSQHSQVEFNVSTRTTQAIEQSLLEGTLDAGIIMARRHLSQLDARTLYQERHSLYCAEKHPLFHKDPASISIEEIAQYDYAGFTEREEVDRVGRARCLIRSACADSVEAMATLVASGCFMAMLPDHYVQSVWRLRNFKSILPEVFSVTVDIELITRHSTSASLVLALLDVVDRLDPPASAKTPNPPRLQVVEPPRKAPAEARLDLGHG